MPNPNAGPQPTPGAPTVSPNVGAYDPVTQKFITNQPAPSQPPGSRILSVDGNNVYSTIGGTSKKLVGSYLTPQAAQAAYGEWTGAGTNRNIPGSGTVFAPSGGSTSAPGTPGEVSGQSGQPSGGSDAGSFYGSPQEQQLSSAIDALSARLISGGQTPEEQAQIQQAVDAARAQYQVLVDQAEQSKAQGLPQALVTAGQRGGLMNSQFAGAAALTKTAGGNFYGAGGELERIQSVYDKNIQNIQAQQLQAMNDAATATKKAIRTGQMEDLQVAQNLYDHAQKKAQELQAEAAAKAKAIQDWNDNLDKTADKTVDDYIKAGVSSQEIDPQELKALDINRGLQPGTSARAIDIGYQDRASKTTQDFINVQKSLTDYFTKIPPGSPPITINGTTYSVVSNNGATTGTENGQDGNWLWASDPNTGALLSVTKISDIDHGAYQDFTSQDGLHVKRVYADKYVQYFDGTQHNMGYPSDTNGLVANYPQSSVTPYTRDGGNSLADQKAAAQCGAWVNDVTGIGVGDTYASKQAKMDKSITADTAQIGDVFIQPAGSTGHIGIINGIFVDPETGLKSYRVSESNWTKNAQGVGLITHDRLIPASVATGFAHAKFVHPEDNFGTDTGGSVQGDNGVLYGNKPVPVTTYGDLTEAQFKALNTIQDNARQDQNIKDFPAVRASFETARSAASQPGGAGDIVLMRMLAKITDPTTGVREEEFNTFSDAQGTLAKFGIKLTKQMWSGGRLTEDGRKSLLNQAQDIYDQRKDAYNNSMKFYEGQAAQAGLPSGRVMPYYVAPDTETKPPAGTSPVPGLASPTDITAIRNQLPAGQIIVQDKKTGEFGYILPSEYDSSLYIKIQ